MSLATREILKATLFGLIIAFVIVGLFALLATALNGAFTVEAEEFVPVVEWGDEVDIDGINIVDNRTLGMIKAPLTKDKIVSIDDTDQAGRKKIVFKHENKEFTVYFDVKYRVEFFAYGELLDTQLVIEKEELNPPTATPKTGYEFSHWDFDLVNGELNKSIQINAVFKEIEYPTLPTYTATYGDTLESIDLPKNTYGVWEFMTDETTPVGDAGINSYLVRFRFFDDEEYFRYDTVNIDVKPKELEFKDVKDTFVYDGNVYFPTYTLDVPDLYVITIGEPTSEAGEYAYNFEISDRNYVGSYSGTFTIEKPEVNIIVSSATIVYGDPVPEFTYTISGFENVDLLGIEIDAPTRVYNVGDYDIGITYTNNNVKYNIQEGLLRVEKADLEIELPEYEDVTFADRLGDIEFTGRYLGTWEWENPDQIVDDINGVTAWAIYTPDNSNYNTVRMRIDITKIAKKQLTINLEETTYIYAPSTERTIKFVIEDGSYTDVMVEGNDPESNAGRYTKILEIVDPRYFGSVTVDLVINKATPVTDFTTVYDAVWNENLLLSSITLPEGYKWDRENTKIEEIDLTYYPVTYTHKDSANYVTVTGMFGVYVEKSAVTVNGVDESYNEKYVADRNYILDITSRVKALDTDGELSIKFFFGDEEIFEIVNVGEYKMIVTVSEGTKYYGTTIERTINITPAENTEIVNVSQSAIFGDSLDVLKLPKGVEGTWSWKTDDTTVGNAGSNVIIAQFICNTGNYENREVEVTVDVAKKAVDLPLVADKLYVEDIITSGLVDTDLYTVVLDEGGIDIGTYYVTLKLVDSSNYRWAGTDGTDDEIKVSYGIKSVENEWTENPAIDGWTYLGDPALPSADVKYGGYVVHYKRDGSSDETYTLDVPTLAGDYIARFTSTDENCTIISTTVKFTIAKKGIDVPTLSVDSFVYNGQSHNSGILSTELYTVTDRGGVNKGTYTVTIKISDYDNYCWSGREGNTVEYTYTITKAPNSVTAPTVGEWTYNDTDVLKKLSATPVFGTVVYYFSAQIDGEYTTTVPTEAGTYYVKSVVAEDRIYGNWASAESEATEFVIKKATPTIEGLLDKYTTTYNPDGDYVIGGVSASNGVELEFTYVYGGESASAIRNAGTYTVTVTIPESDNYVEVSDTTTVEVEQAQTPDEVKTAQKATYLDTLDKLELPEGTEGTWTWDTDATTVGDAGTQYFTAKYVSTTKNYKDTTVTVTVTVDKYKVDLPEYAKSLKYNSKHQNLGLENTDLYTVTDIGGTNCGSYKATLTLTDPDNYTWGTEGKDYVLDYTIVTVDNTWVKAPTMPGWTFGSEASEPDAQAQFGSYTVIYLDENGKELPGKPSDAGTYTARFTTDDKEASTLTKDVVFVIAKLGIDVPKVGDDYKQLDYTGLRRYSDLKDLVDKRFEVLDSGAINVSTVTVYITLTDNNYKWNGHADDDRTATDTYSIVQADTVITGFTVSDIIYGAAPAPSATTNFGTLTYLYSTAIDGEYKELSELLVDGKLEVGTYYVKAVVAEDASAYKNWSDAQTEPLSFKVDQAEGEITNIASDGEYSRDYNGTAYEITGLVSNSGAQITINYAQGMTDAGVYEFTVVLSSTKNYTGKTYNVKVTINQIENTQTIDRIGAIYEDVISEFNNKLPENIEGEWKWQTPNAEVGNATAEGEVRTFVAIFTPETNSNGLTNYAYRELEVEFTVAKRNILDRIPEYDDTLDYIAKDQTLGIEPTDLYTVEDVGGKDAGDNYKAILTLTHPENYTWGTASADYEIPYSIIKVMNDWTYLPEDNLSFSYLESLDDLIATAKLGGVKIEYKLADELDTKYTETVPVYVEDYVVRYTITDPNCTNYLASETRKFSITKIDYDMSGITFSGDEVTYDGYPHSIFITGELPDGVTVDYVGNGKITANEAGYTVIAKFTGDSRNYNAIADMTAKLVINKDSYDMSGITFEDKEVIYDGEKHSVVITGTLPDGVTVEYVGNEMTDANETGYTVTAKFSGDFVNYNTIADMTATLTIKKATVTGITFEDKTVTYDGNKHSIVIGGTELPEGVSVTYSGADFVTANEAGYEITATFTVNGNYNDIDPMTATLKIMKADYDMSGITFSGDEVTYDGYPHSIFITGELPDGVTVDYVGNGKITANEAGYTVIAKFTGDSRNYNAIADMTAKLVINKDSYDMSGITFEDVTIDAYDGKTYSIVIGGTLPKGVSVTYENNGQTEANEAGYTVTAKFTGDSVNYNAIADMTATLKIMKATVTGITFEDKEVTYEEGVKHSIVIGGTLPEGVSVTYSGTDYETANEEGYEITATFTVNGNYNDIDPMTAKLVIKKAGVTINGIKDSYVFGYVKGTDYYSAVKTGITASNGAELDWEITSFKKHDGTAVPGVETVENAGYYVITVSVPESTNYKGASEPINVTVKKASHIVPDVQNEKYAEGALIDITKTQSAICGENDIYGVTGDLQVTESNTYTVYFTLKDPDNNEWKGKEALVQVSDTYRVSAALNGWKDGKAPVDIWDYVFDGKPVEVECELIHGTAANVQIVYVDNATGKPIDGAPVHVGTYTAYVYVTGVTNYEDFEDDVTIEITPQPITPPLANTGLVYDGVTVHVGVTNPKEGDKYYGIYEVIDGTAKNAGTSYEATVRLLNTDYKWEGKADDVREVKVPYVVDKAPTTIDNILTGDGSYVYGYVKNHDYYSTVKAGISASNGEELHWQIVSFTRFNGVTENVDTVAEAGYYVIKVYVNEVDNYHYKEEIINVTVNRHVVTPPITALPEYTYNNDTHKHPVTEYEGFKIDSFTDAFNAGEKVTLNLKLESLNYVWNDKTTADKYFESTVKQDEIEISDLTINDWMFERDQESVPYASIIESQRAYPGIRLYYEFSTDGVNYVSYVELLKTHGTKDESGNLKLNARDVYYVRAVVDSDENWIGVIGESATFTVERLEVIIPDLVNTDLVFNGTTQYSGITSTKHYTVVDEGGMDARDDNKQTIVYTATLTLTDSTNYRWVEKEEDESEAEVVMTFALRNPAVATVEYTISAFTFKSEHVDNDGKTAEYSEEIDLGATLITNIHNDVNLHKYVSYKYSSDGETWVDTLEDLADEKGNLKKGDYKVKTIIEATNNWDYYEKVDDFEIIKKVVEVPKAQTGLVYDSTSLTGVKVADGYEGIYEVVGGTATVAGPHTATVTLLDPSNFEWKDEEGEDYATKTSVDVDYEIAKTQNGWTTVPHVVLGTQSVPSVRYKDPYDLVYTATYDNGYVKTKYRVYGSDDEYTDGLPTSSDNKLGADGVKYEIVVYTENAPNTYDFSETILLTIKPKIVNYIANIGPFTYGKDAQGNEIVHKHGIAAQDGLVFSEEVSATKAGATVSVKLSLKDENYIWSDGSIDSYTREATVAKATDNTWTAPTLVFTNVAGVPTDGRWYWSGAFSHTGGAPKYDSIVIEHRVEGSIDEYTAGYPAVAGTFEIVIRTSGDNANELKATFHNITVTPKPVAKPTLTPGEFNGSAHIPSYTVGDKLEGYTVTEVQQGLNAGDEVFVKARLDDNYMWADDETTAEAKVSYVIGKASVAFGTNTSITINTWKFSETAGVVTAGTIKSEYASLIGIRTEVLYSKDGGDYMTYSELFEEYGKDGHLTVGSYSVKTVIVADESGNNNWDRVEESTPVTFTVSEKIISVPELNDIFYNGSLDREGTLKDETDLNAGIYKVIASIKAGNANNTVSLTVDLLDKTNYKWNDNTTAAKTVETKIKPATVSFATVTVNNGNTIYYKDNISVQFTLNETFVDTTTVINTCFYSSDGVTWYNSIENLYTERGLEVGDYYVKVTVADPSGNGNWEDKTSEATLFHVSPKIIDLPSLKPLAFIGLNTPQSPVLDLTDEQYNELVGKVYGIVEDSEVAKALAGETVSLNLKLLDTKNYTWSDNKGNGEQTVDTVIAKANPTIKDFTVNDDIRYETLPSGSAKADFGTPEILYATSIDGEYKALSELLNENGFLPAGVTYYAKAVVAEDANWFYAEIPESNIKSFTVNKFVVTAPTLDTTKPVVFGFDNKYHSLTFIENSEHTKYYDINDNQQTNKGVYTVTVELKDTANYEWDDASKLEELTLTINQAEPTVTVTVKPWTFGDVVTALTDKLTVSVSPYVGGYDVKFYDENGELVVDEQGKPTVPTKAGDYTVKVSVAADNSGYGNWTANEDTASFEILKKQGSFSHGDTTIVDANNKYKNDAYDFEDILGITGVVSDISPKFVITGYEGADGKPVTDSELPDVIKNAGLYTVVVTLPESDNYLGVSTPVTFTVRIFKDTASFTVPGDDQLTVSYDSTKAFDIISMLTDIKGEKEPELIITGYKDADGKSAPIPGEIKAAGTYTVTIRITESNNYEEAKVENIKVVINRADPGLDATIKTHTYDGNSYDITEFITGSVTHNEEVTYRYVLKSYVNGKGENVTVTEGMKIQGAGAYTIEVSVTGNKNYESSTKDFTVNVGKNSIGSQTVNNVPYGTTLGGVSLTLPEGKFTWNDATTTAVGSVGANTFVGKYVSTSGNYYDNGEVSVTVNVVKANVTISGVNAEYSDYYSGSDFLDIIRGSIVVKRGDTELDITDKIKFMIGNAEITELINKNTVEVTVIYTGDANHNPASVTTTIEIKAITVGITDFGIKNTEDKLFYGDLIKIGATLTVNGVANTTVIGPEFIFEYKTANGAWTAFDPTKTLPVGTYQFQVRIAADPNGNWNEVKPISTDKSITIQKVEPNKIYFDFVADEHQDANGKILSYYLNSFVFTELKAQYEDASGKVIDVPGTITYTINFKGTNSTITFNFTPDDTKNATAYTETVDMPFKVVAVVGSSYVSEYTYADPENNVIGNAFGTIEDAIAAADKVTSGKNVWVVPDKSGFVKITEDITIKNGVSLILPYGAASDAGGRNQSGKATLTETTKAPGRIDDVNLQSQVVLATGKTITIDKGGLLEISGELSGGLGGSKYAGQTAGKHSRLVLEANSHIICSGTIKAYGYIWEDSLDNDSSVTIKNGGVLYQPLVLRDFKGGSLMYGLYNNMGSKECSPFNQLQFINVHPTTKYEYGGKCMSWANLYAGSQHNHTEGTLISTGSQAFIQMTDPDYSSIVAKYNKDTDIMQLDLYGGARTNALSLTVKYIFSVEVSSNNFIYALSWLQHITLNKAEGQLNADYYMDQQYKMLPGSKFTVNEGATLNVKLLSVYDEFNDLIPTGKYPSVYPDTCGVLKGTKIDSAKLTVNGNLIANSLAGDVYASSNEALVTVAKATTITTHEATASDGTTITGWQDITRNLNLIYEGSTEGVTSVELGTKYMSNSSTKKWEKTEYIKITIPAGTNITIDSAKYGGSNELRGFSGVTTTDMDFYVLPGTSVKYNLAAGQIAAIGSTVELTSAEFGNLYKARTYEWKATIGSAPIVYDGLPTVSLKLDTNTSVEKVVIYDLRNTPYMEVTLTTGSRKLYKDGGELSMTVNAPGCTVSMNPASGSVTGSSGSGSNKTVTATVTVKSGTYTITANTSWTEGTPSSGGSGCVTPDTLITLADGTQVRVDSLTGNEMLLVWNLETGAWDYAPIMFVDSEALAEVNVVYLHFSDGTVVKVIYEHGFWDYDLNRYVYLDENASDYIGHYFAKHNGDELAKVQLVDVEIKTELTTAWSPVTVGHLCYVVNGMLSMPGGVGGLFNIFDVDADTMTYDYEAMARDIETYGLFTYEELNAICPLSESMFEAAGGAYLKVSIGKGNLTMDELITMINRYSVYFE